jgi:hypothetical protein
MPLIRAVQCGHQRPRVEQDVAIDRHPSTAPVVRADPARERIPLRGCMIECN